MNSLLTKEYFKSEKIGCDFINNNSEMNINVKSVIESYFQWKYNKKCIISNIQINWITNKVQIQFFYYMAPVKNNKVKNRYKKVGINGFIKQTKNIINDVSLYFSETKTKKSNFLLNLSKVLQNIFGKKVELICNRVHYPYMNAQIFSQYLSNNSRSKRFINFTQSIFTFPSYNGKDLPVHIVGIKITLSGRIITERSIPRKTVKSKIKGTFTSAKPGPEHVLIIDKGFTEMKNELGQFRISVEIAQIRNKIL